MDISLIIPVLNEQMSLPRLLESIRQQALPPAEVIFVDAGSSDGTQSLIRNAAQADFRFRLLVEPGATPGRGRNVGIQAASNPWIALTDAGMELDPHWLKDLAAGLAQKPSAAVIYGNFRPRTDSYFAECLALAYVPPLHKVEGGQSRGPVIPSSLIKREAWAAAGGFPDLRAAEDRIFMERIAEIQIPTASAPNALVTWDLPGSVGKVFSRFKTYSMHNVLAGRQRDWHTRIARMYLAALILGVGAAYVHIGFWLLLFLLGLARSAKGIIKRRDEHSILWCLRPDRVIAVFALLLWIDLATFTGWFIAVWRQLATHKVGKEVSMEGDSKVSGHAPDG